jgi:hypothetical protein
MIDHHSQKTDIKYTNILGNEAFFSGIFGGKTLFLKAWE